jgi:hypothetical protein
MMKVNGRKARGNSPLRDVALSAVARVKAGFASSKASGVSELSIVAEMAVDPEGSQLSRRSNEGLGIGRDGRASLDACENLFPTVKASDAFGSTRSYHHTRHISSKAKSQLLAIGRETAVQLSSECSSGRTGFICLISLFLLLIAAEEFGGCLVILHLPPVARKGGKG